MDLLVPAHAECVIEGFVRPGSRETEGPFGEFLGYLSGAAPAPVVDITAITHRSTPLHHGFVQQLPPSDGHLVMEMGFLGPLWFNLTRKLGVRASAISPSHVEAPVWRFWLFRLRRLMCRRVLA